MRRVRVIEDVNPALDELWDSLRPILNRDIDLHGRRVVNSNKSVNPHDLIRRDEVDNLVQNAILNLDSGDVVREIVKTTESIGIKNPILENIRISQDGIFDIGESGNKNWLKNIFSDNISAETFRFSFPGIHTPDWTLEQTAVGVLELDDTSGNLVVQFGHSINEGYSIRAHDSIFPNNDSVHDLGATATRWANLFIRDIDITGEITGNAGPSDPFDVGDFKPESNNARMAGTAGSIFSEMHSRLFIGGVSASIQGTLRLHHDVTSGSVSLGVDNTGGALHLRAFDDIVPDTDGGEDLGLSSLRWGNLFSQNIDIDGNFLTDLTGNFTAAVNSGNFYLRTFTGSDANCSGITDGWIGYRIDTNEIQICDGGATLKIALA